MSTHQPSLSISDSSMTIHSYTNQDSLTFKEIHSTDQHALTRFASELSTWGFTRLYLKNTQWIKELSTALEYAQIMNEFRFPPIDQEVCYPPEYQRCFKTLFEIACTCLHALLHTCTKLEKTPDPTATIWGRQGGGTGIPSI